MKTIIQQRGTPHSLTHRLGRAAAYAAIGWAGIIAPVAHGQTNTNGCTAAPAGLVGWWRAEGDAADFTGANSGSFPFGSGFAAGVVGQAFDFDGSSRRVSIPDSPALQLTNAMTLEAWVYPRAYGGFITFRGDNRGGLDNWTLDTYDSGFVKFTLIDPANNVATVRAALALNQWQHVAATWSRASGDLQIYINGTLSAQTNSPLVPIGALDPASEPAIGIGNHGGTFHQFPFNGLIDELGIYNRALNANEVALIYQAGSAGKCTTTNSPAGPGVPVITSFTPAAAIPGGQVVIAGQNFSPGAASNTVYFGATKATVLNASTNQLIVAVPVGATFAPPTVTVNGLTAAAQAAFTPTFAGTGVIASTNFAPRFSLGTGTGPTQTAIADFDGDGKPDLAATDDYADSISVYRNISAGGGLSGSSFESRIVLPASTANYSPYMLIAGDVDGDGRLDLVASDVEGNTVSVFRNQATPGSLSSNSFAPFVTFAVGNSPRAVALVDLDGDGRPEIGTANYNSSTVSILRNVSAPGVITATSFAPRTDFPVGAGPQGLVVTDLDGDGRSDLATGNSSSHTISLLRNLGTGTITSNLFAAAVTFSGPNYAHFLKAIDLDSDGRPELLVSSYLGQSVSLYRNQSTPGGFTATSFALVTAPALSGRGHTLAGGDLNGDGKPDIAIDTELADSVTLFQNLHTSGDVTAASLGARVDLPAGWNAWGTSIGDLDGDHRPDLVVANTYDNTISIYQNLAAVSSNPPSAAGWLLSVDFGSDLNGKTGFAALGQTTNDFWNFYSRDDGAGGWRTFGVLSNLKTVDGTVTPAGLTVANAPGAWGNGSPDQMYDDYIYPFNGGNVTVTVTNLPAGQYDLLAYAYDGNFELTAGGVSLGVQTTRDNIRTNLPGWAAGVQYARFTNVSVAVGQPLVLTVRPGLDGYAVISGLQLSASLSTNTVPGTNPPAGNCVAVPTGAISWWRGEGSTLDNIRTNHGTVVGGVTTVPGKVGNGFGFDGTGYLVVPHDPSLNNSNALTIELWYRPAGDSNPDYGLIDKRVGFTGANYGINVVAAAGLGVYYDDLGVQDGDDTGSSFESSRYTPIPAPDGFHHLAATYVQFSNNLVRLELYLDGQNVRTRYIAGNLANTINTTPVTIGATAQGAGEFFKGVIDEVTLYNRVLSAAEIQSIYGADAAGKCGTPITNPPPFITCYDASESFTTNRNPNGVWSYGHSVTLGDALIPFSECGNWGGLDFWRSNIWLSVPAVFYNPSTQAVINPTATFVLNPGQLALHPGPNGEFAVIRFTVPSDDSYQITADFTGADILGTTTDVHLLLNGSPQRGGLVDGYGPGSGPSINTNLALRAGDHLDFAVGRGANNEFSYDSTAVAIQICASSNQPPIVSPTITSQPTNTVVNAGNIARFDVTATGPAPLTYQWFFNNSSNAVLDATAATYTIANTQPAQAGDYFVIVSNPYGAVTSTIATLTVLTYPPAITKQPTNLTVWDGATTNLAVVASGTGPLSYQWFFKDQPLAGRTNPSLILPNAQTNNTGAYFVTVSNAYGSVTSSVAIFTVNPRPPCAPIHDGLVSWWRGENNQLDGWGDNNGTLPGSLKYAAGKVGQAFSSPTLNVTDAPALRVTNALTLEAWINPTIVTGTTRQTLFSKYDFSQTRPPVLGQSSFYLGITNGQLLFLVSPDGYDQYASSNGVVFSTQRLTANQWSHVAATYDGLALRLYINGSLVAQNNYSRGIFAGMANLGIGVGVLSGQSTIFPFNGLLDEASFYNRALSAAEIEAIAAADLTGKCLAPPLITQQPQSQGVPLGEDVKLTATVMGTRPQTYQWFFNGPTTQFQTQRIIGATNAALVIEKIKTNNVGTYTLRVTNSAGFDISAPAQLSLEPAPACTEMLPGLISWWPGNSNKLDALGVNNLATLSPGIYATGKVGAAFVFNGLGQGHSVNNSASLNFGANTNFSIEMWIKASPSNSVYRYPFQTSNPNIPLFEKRDLNSIGWKGYSLSLYNGRLAFGLGALNVSTNALYISNGPDLRDDMFHHVAVTLNRNVNTGGVLYVDGTPVLVFDPRTFTNSLQNTAPLYIGLPATSAPGSLYIGLIDEPAIYNRALTAAEILAIRTAGAAGRCKAAPVIITQPTDQFVTNGGSATLSVAATGTPLLRYQWRRNVVPVPGGTNSTLVLSNITASLAGTYSVIVSNAFGSVTSSNAIVAINRLPVANPDSLTTPSNTAAVFPAAKLLLNDTDADGDVLNVASVSGISSQNGSVSLVSNVVTYTPPVNFTGNDTFTYLLTDRPGVTTVGTVMVTVGSGGAAPMNIIAGPTVLAGQFVVRFAGIPGLTYTIETATSLAGPWTKVANLTAPETDAGLGVGIFEFSEPVVGEGARYYRTVYPAY